MLRIRTALEGLLRNLVQGRVELMLKPDAYTHCRVYQNNPWRIPPVIQKTTVTGRRTVAS